MKARNFPSYDTREASLSVALKEFDVSRTDQAGKDEADINTLVRRFGLTGMMPVVARPPEYGDFEGIFDYQSAQNLILAADKSFMAMPADVRSRFNNDPALFVDFCSNPANLDEMRRLGLAVPAPVEPEPAPVEPAPAGPL